MNASAYAEAIEVCHMCPVMKECAADAIYPLAVGTIRAGVILPPIPTGAPARRARAMLKEIARV